MLDEREGVSYPDVAQDQKGKIYIVYDRNRYTDREILMAVIRESQENGFIKLIMEQSAMMVDKP